MMHFLKKLHKWISLLLGIQVLLWTVSGLVLSSINPDKVSGREWVKTVSNTPQIINSNDLLEPADLDPSLLENATGVSLEIKDGRTVYMVGQPQSTTMIDAATGAVITISELDAKLRAQQDFGGKGGVLSVERGTAPDLETRNSTGPYWRVNFSDKANTSIYVSVSTGDILERRNTYWRVFDFFWMLHIMDYAAHEDINNSLIIIVGLITIWLGISGFILLFSSFNRDDFLFLNPWRKNNEVTITLFDASHSEPTQVRLRKDSNLFHSLSSNNINVPSVCGGGGECGKCRVKIDAPGLPPANDAEQSLIPKRMRESGFRLACQQKVENNMTVWIATGSPDSSNRTRKSPV